MILETRLKHLETDQEIKEIINNQENVVICCGRMGPMCTPVYAAMEKLREESEYSNVAFADLAFDTQDAIFIRKLPEVRTFRGLPFTVYFKNGKVVKATASIQTKENLINNINSVF